MSTQRPTHAITRIIIHCAATPNGACWHAEDVNQWHSERGFQRSRKHNVNTHLHAIGYHYVIETSGQIVRGRSLEESGAHVRGHNADSIGICLIGTDAYTLDQWHSLKGLITGLRRRFGDLEVIGHCDVDERKTCPGFDVAAWLNNRMEVPSKHWFQPNHLTGS